MNRDDRLKQTDTYDYQREMRRRAKLKAQHDCYEESYAEAAQELSKELWFQALPQDMKERHTCFRAVSIFWDKDCSKGD